jgi:hypothetical protein
VFYYAENEIPFGLAQDRLRLRGVYPERSEGLRLRMTAHQFEVDRAPGWRSLNQE